MQLRTGVPGELRDGGGGVAVIGPPAGSKASAHHALSIAIHPEALHFDLIS